MSINASKTCAAKSAAKLDTFFGLGKTFSPLFLELMCFGNEKTALSTKFCGLAKMM
jgi:hypothetical protein